MTHETETERYHRNRQLLIDGHAYDPASEKDADFLVLDANPLDDITNTQRISKMYLKGLEIDRERLRPSLTRTFAN